MSEFQLCGPEDAAVFLTGVVLGTGRAKITVHEDKALKAGSRWSLGRVGVEGDPADPEQMRFAIENGEYEWAVPEVQPAREALVDLLSIETPAAGAQKGLKEAHEKHLGRVERILDAVASAATRLGMTHPVFDPRSMEDMPFRRSATVVADTSGVLQGGLDFVARFLHPSARLKVPAVVHMEVVSRTTVWRLLTQHCDFDHSRMRFGARKAHRLFKGLRGRLEAKRILDVAIFDHTPVDCFVVDDVSYTPVGRPYLTFCIDVRSRYPLGYVVSFTPPSVETVMACLRRVVRPKKRYQTLREWVAFGVPRTILVDNGLEFVGGSFKDACEDAGISVECLRVGVRE